MATIQAVKVSSTTEQMPGVGDGQSLKAVVATYTFGAAPNAGDVLLSSLIQTGCCITGVKVTNATGAAITAGVVGTPAYFISSSTAAVQSMNVANPAYIMPANGNVTVTFAAGGAAGVVNIEVTFLPLNA